MPLVRRRPLLRAAMVGGAGYAAGKHRAHNRAHQEAQERQAATQDMGGSMSEMDRIDALKKLGDLHDSGVLTDEQFESEKEKLL